MIELEPMHSPEMIAPVDPLETLATDLILLAQRLRELGNPPEMVMRQGATEEGVYSPYGLTQEQAYRLFNFDSERINLLKWNVARLGENTHQEKLSLFEDIWTDAPSNWADYGTITAVSETIYTVAQRWNHPKSSMSDYEVAALLIANLHQESHLRRDNPAANQFANQVGVIKDILGDANFTFRGKDSCLGPANLRPSVVDEMLGTAIQTPFIPTPTDKTDTMDFKDESRLDALEQEWLSFGNTPLGNRSRIAFLYDFDKAIELMGANFYRGIARLGQQRLQPTMFNMSAWLSQGIAESATLSAHTSEEVSNAINHARETVRFVNAIIANKETFGMFGDSDEFTDWDNFVLFNEDDLRAYLRY